MATWLACGEEWVALDTLTPDLSWLGIGAFAEAQHLENRRRSQAADLYNLYGNGGLDNPLNALYGGQQQQEQWQAQTLGNWVSAYGLQQGVVDQQQQAALRAQAQQQQWQWEQQQAAAYAAPASERAEAVYRGACSALRNRSQPDQQHRVGAPMAPRYG